MFTGSWGFYSWGFYTIKSDILKGTAHTCAWNAPNAVCTKKGVRQIYIHIFQFTFNYISRVAHTSRKYCAICLRFSDVSVEADLRFFRDFHSSQQRNIQILLISEKVSKISYFIYSFPITPVIMAGARKRVDVGKILFPHFQ